MFVLATPPNVKPTCAQRMHKSCSQALRDASVLIRVSQRQVHVPLAVLAYTPLGRKVCAGCATRCDGSGFVMSAARL